MQPQASNPMICAMLMHLTYVHMASLSPSPLIYKLVKLVYMPLQCFSGEFQTIFRKVLEGGLLGTDKAGKVPCQQALISRGICRKPLGRNLAKGEEVLRFSRTG